MAPKRAPGTKSKAGKAAKAATKPASKATRPAPKRARKAEPFRVALTFDAEHPDRASTYGAQERVLDVLDKLDVKGTFFVQGRWAEAYPDTAARIAKAGHLVGNHSHYHARLPQLNSPGLAWDIRTAEEKIKAITGVDPKPWFRNPFGAGATDARVLREIAKAGYTHVGWTVEADDWEPDPPVRQLVDLIVEGFLNARDESVALLHTWPKRVEKALPEIVKRARDAGATFVRVDKLDTVIAIPSGPTPSKS
jgi:peptidoglycan/xylan/chitin deacetylase (PgdA/CDA1 family)